MLGFGCDGINNCNHILSIINNNIRPQPYTLTKKSRTLAGAALYVLDGLELNEANGFFCAFKQHLV